MLAAACLLASLTFVAYMALLVPPFLRQTRTTPGDPSRFEWHFLVPCLDEASVIERTVLALHDSFPAARIWCVDDGSVDGTPDILLRLAGAIPNVHVVSRRLPDARRGKGAALNAGWNAIRRSVPSNADLEQVVVGVIDADARLSASSLQAICGPQFFGSSVVGAVQTGVRVAEPVEAESREVPSSLLIRLQDMEFRGPIAAMQLLRRHTGSVGMGGNGQFTRLSVLNRVAAEHGTPWHNSLLEDFELGVRVLLQGSRSEYCHHAQVAQEGLPDARLLLRQRTRWSQGAMQCLRYLRPVLKSACIGTAGKMEITYFLMGPWLRLLLGLIFIVSTVVAVGYGVTLGFGGPPNAQDWLLLSGAVMLGLVPFFVWGPIYGARAGVDISRRDAWMMGAANCAYAYLQHIAPWWAAARLARSRNDWKKTPRIETSGSPAVDAGVSLR